MKLLILPLMFCLICFILPGASNLHSASAQTCSLPLIGCPQARIQTQVGQVNDNYYGSTITEATQGENINVSVTINVDANCAPCYFSIGFALDNVPNYTSTASGYTNSSIANPNKLLAASAGPATATIAAPVPTTLSNLIVHRWQVDVVQFSTASGPRSNESIVGETTGEIAVISSTQSEYWLASEYYTQTQSAFSFVFGDSTSNYLFNTIQGTIFSSPDNYLYAGVATQIGIANLAYAKAQQDYQNGNFSGAASNMNSAASHEQAAVILYQSASQVLVNNSTNQNGAPLPNSTYSDLLSIGVILLGAGAIICGIGLVLRRKA